MAIIVRSDLKLPKGKIASQCAHAAVACYQLSEQASPALVKRWILSGQPKVILKVDNMEEMAELKTKADELKTVSVIIKDAGRTVVAPGTVTVMGLGPDDIAKIDEVVSKLKLL